MATNANLREALNDCIDRLNDGESLHDILEDYPGMANQLRPMLEAGLLTSKARYPVVDLTNARESLDVRIQQTIETNFGGGFYIGWLSGLFILLLISGLLLAGVYLNTLPITAESTVTPSPTSRTIVTPTTSLTSTALPPTTEPITVIEGPISAVDDDTITIYDQIIVIDDPRLQGLQPGDVIRLERRTDTSGQSALILSVINVTILVNTDGQIWRDDDCATPPPAWATDRDGVGEWQARCTVNPPVPPPSSSDNSNSSDDDDDDDD